MQVEDSRKEGVLPLKKKAIVSSCPVVELSDSDSEVECERKGFGDADGNGAGVQLGVQSTGGSVKPEDVNMTALGKRKLPIWADAAEMHAKQPHTGAADVAAFGQSFANDSFLKGQASLGRTLPNLKPMPDSGLHKRLQELSQAFGLQSDSLRLASSLGSTVLGKSTGGGSSDQFTSVNKMTHPAGPPRAFNASEPSLFEQAKHLFSAISSPSVGNSQKQQHRLVSQSVTVNEVTQAEGSGPYHVSNGRVLPPAIVLSHPHTSSDASTRMLPGGFAPGSLHAIRAGYGAVVGSGHGVGGGAGYEPDEQTSLALRGVLEGLQMGQLREEVNVPDGLLRMPLLKHQRLALAWMTKRESSYPAGGILADDQGLGKTVTTISLILKARSPNSDSSQNDLRLLSSKASHATVNLEDDEVEGPSLVKESKKRRGGESVPSSSRGAAVGFVDLLDDDEKQNHARSMNGENGAMVPCSPSQCGEFHGGKDGCHTSSSGAGKNTCNPPAFEGRRAGKRVGRNSGRASAGTLVVCPTSVLRQWAAELKEKVEDEARLSVLVYHGSNRIKDPEELASYGVVLTTYAIVTMEVPKPPTEKEEGKKSVGLSSTGGVILSSQTSSSAGGSGQRKGSKSQKGRGRGRPKRKAEDGDEGEEALLSPGAGPLARCAWFRVVLDEAQSIKNRSTQVARACWGLRAKRRWCLSGTPIQNSVDDLYSYFRFLRWHPFDEYSAFRSQVKDAIVRNPTTGWKKLQSILQAVMLRRTKATKIDGKPIINLPGRIVTLQQTDFSPAERAFYTNLEESSREQFKDYAKAGTVQSNYVNILVLLLQLRQACDHPALVKRRSSSLRGEEGEGASEEVLQAARKLPIHEIERLLSMVKRDCGICAICEDAAEDPVVSVCSHVFCRQCAAERWPCADPVPSLCPACRRPLSPSDVHAPSVLRACLLQSTTARKLEKAGFGGTGCRMAEPGSGLGGAAKVKQELECGLSSLSGGREYENPTMGDRDVKNVRPGGAMKGSDFLTSSKIQAVLQTLTNLPKMAVEIEDGRMVRRVDEKKLQADEFGSDNWKDAETNWDCKPIVVPDSGRKRQYVEVREKAIVFSQWTSMLNLLEPALKRAGFGYSRLDGTMSIQARDRAITDFKTRPEVNVIIMSLKAASLGLNMVAACHVLLLDVWWNPATEEQAIDRAHRIGQTRTVHVSRFAIRNTIEDRILELQEKKRVLVASAFGEKDGADRSTRLTTDDLHFLFRT